MRKHIWLFLSAAFQKGKRWWFLICMYITVQLFTYWTVIESIWRNYQFFYSHCIYVFHEFWNFLEIKIYMYTQKAEYENIWENNCQNLKHIWSFTLWLTGWIVSTVYKNPLYISGETFNFLGGWLTVELSLLFFFFSKGKIGLACFQPIKYLIF